jgi:predicted phage gp36 major capsid-like protein
VHALVVVALDLVELELTRRRREFRAELTGELQAATAKLDRLRDQEREVAAGGELRDAEEETLRRLGAVRHMIAGRVTGAEGLNGVRAALLQLFEGFTLHVAGAPGAPQRVHAELAWVGQAGYLIEPHVRPQVVEGYSKELTPILRREPLCQVENNSYNSLPFTYLFGAILVGKSAAG